MPWSCPKCGLHLRPGDNPSALPTPGEVFRCPVCKLPVTFDEVIGKMKPVNAPIDHGPKKPNVA